MEILDLVTSNNDLNTRISRDILIKRRNPYNTKYILLKYIFSIYHLKVQLNKSINKYWGQVCVKILPIEGKMISRGEIKYYKNKIIEISNTTNFNINKMKIINNI